MALQPDRDVCVRSKPHDGCAVEETAAEYLDGELLDEKLDPDALVPWVVDVMHRAGWVGDGVPTFVLDVPDESDVSGWYEGRRGIIHLHPLLLGRWLVLHELAHWLRPLDGHGPQFAAVLLGLVGAGLGEEAAAELQLAYLEHGVEVDASYLD